MQREEMIQMWLDMGLVLIDNLSVAEERFEADLKEILSEMHKILALLYLKIAHLDQHIAPTSPSNH